MPAQPPTTARVFGTARDMNLPESSFASYASSGGGASGGALHGGIGIGDSAAAHGAYGGATPGGGNASWLHSLSSTFVDDASFALSASGVAGLGGGGGGGHLSLGGGGMSPAPSSAVSARYHHRGAHGGGGGAYGGGAPWSSRPPVLPG